MSSETHIQNVELVNAQLREGTAFDFLLKNYDGCFVPHVTVTDEKRSVVFPRWIGHEEIPASPTKFRKNHPMKGLMKLLDEKCTNELARWQGKDADAREIRKLVTTQRVVMQYMGDGRGRGCVMPVKDQTPARYQLRRLAVLLSRHVNLEVGFYHVDVEPEHLSGKDDTYGGEDRLDGCACRFRLTIPNVNWQSEWWLAPGRVKKILLCAKENNQEFDASWKRMSPLGWGYGGEY